MKTHGRLNPLLALALLVTAPSALAQTVYVPGGTVGTSSNGNVGIGTSTPGSKLTVVGNIKSSTGDIQVDAAHGLIDVSAAASVMFDGNGKITATTQNNQPFVVSGGNVGIGTTSPGTYWSKLEIVDNEAPARVSIGTTLASGHSGFQFLAGGVFKGGFYRAGINDDLEFYTAADGSNPRVLINNASGNVGIGTTNPGGKLQIRSPDAGTVKTYSTSNGFGLILDQYYSAAVELGASYTRTADIVASTGDISSSQIRFLTKPANANPTLAMLISGNGNVGIGTVNPTHKLAVKGTIRANEVIVDTGWSDYVFADDYRLAPLAEVEAHIRAKKHLPGIPSAAEVAEQGVSMGDMQARLLAKVEEVILHQIAQEKRMQRLESENENLRTQLAALSSKP